MIKIYSKVHNTFKHHVPDGAKFIVSEIGHPKKGDFFLDPQDEINVATFDFSTVNNHLNEKYRILIAISTKKRSSVLSAKGG